LFEVTVFDRQAEFSDQNRKFKYSTFIGRRYNNHTQS